MQDATTTDFLLYWGAFVIPLILIVVGAFADKLVEKQPWHWKHFYLGLDLTISALAAGLLNFIDLLKDKNLSGVTVVTGTVFVVTCILCLLGLMGVHQDWVAPEKYGKPQIYRLGIASNLAGAFLLVAFVQLKLRGIL